MGASGLVVAQAFLANLSGLHYALPAVVATQNSTLWNFVFTAGWVFGERARGESRLLRMEYALLTNNVPLLVRVPLLVILTSALGIHHLASNLISFLTLGLTRHPLPSVDLG